MSGIGRRFVDRVTLVTGGASGIGAAVCRRLAVEGATVLVADVDDGAAALLAEALCAEREGAAYPVHLDVAAGGDWRRAAELVSSRAGSICCTPTQLRR